MALVIPNTRVGRDDVITVRGSLGGIYKICVDEMTIRDGDGDRLCVVLADEDESTLSDWAVAVALLLQVDEEEFLRIADREGVHAFGLGYEE